MDYFLILPAFIALLITTYLFVKSLKPQGEVIKEGKQEKPDDQGYTLIDSSDEENVLQVLDSDDDEEDEYPQGVDENQPIQLPTQPFSKNRTGTKKMLKLQRKHERRKHLEYLEERKKEEGRLKTMMDEEEEKKREQQRIQEQLEKQAEQQKQEAKEREHLMWKSEIEVKNTGSREEDRQEKEKKMPQFYETLREKKVMSYEALALEFELTIQEVRNWVQRGLDSGEIMGLADERGRFISVEPDQLELFAKWLVAQENRVSSSQIVQKISELYDK